MRTFPVLLPTHAGGFATLLVGIAAAWYLFGVQCAMYANKIKAGEEKLESLNRDKKVQEVRWGRYRSHDELNRIARAHAIFMNSEPRVQQIAHVRKSPHGSAQPWIIRYHPETQAAMQNGGSAFEFVKKLPAAGAVKRR